MDEEVLLERKSEIDDALNTIFRARDFIKESKFLELIKISEELTKLKEHVHFMRFKPHEWLKRDRQFYNAFMTEIKKHIAKEIEQGLMFVLYNEKPQKVVELVKKVVEDYLKKWEVDDQIAEQIVFNVLSKPEFMKRILSVVTPHAVGVVNKRFVKLKEVACEILKELEEMDHVLDEESRA